MKRYLTVILALIILSVCFLSGCSTTYTVTYMLPDKYMPDTKMGVEIVSEGKSAIGLLSKPEITVDEVTYVFSSWDAFTVGEGGTPVNNDMTVYAIYVEKQISVTIVYIWEELIEAQKANKVSNDKIGIEMSVTMPFASGKQILISALPLYSPAGENYDCEFVCWQKGFNDRIVYNLTADADAEGEFLYARANDIRIYAYFVSVPKTAPIIV